MVYRWSNGNITRTHKWKFVFLLRTISLVDIMYFKLLSYFFFSNFDHYSASFESYSATSSPCLLRSDTILLFRFQSYSKKNKYISTIYARCRYTSKYNKFIIQSDSSKNPYFIFLLYCSYSTSSFLEFLNIHT